MLYMFVLRATGVHNSAGASCCGILASQAALGFPRQLEGSVGRCSHGSCKRRPIPNAESSKTAAFCRLQAREGMVDVVNNRCPHDSRTRRPIFNVVGSKSPARCKQHADLGMLDALKSRCPHHSRSVQPCFNVVGGKMPLHCQQHAEDDGMVNVRSKSCSYDSCTRHPTTFNIVGSKKPAYCKQPGPKTAWWTFAADGVPVVRAQGSRRSMSPAARTRVLQVTCRERYGRRPQQALLTHLVPEISEL